DVEARFDRGGELIEGLLERAHRLAAEQGGDELRLLEQTVQVDAEDRPSHEAAALGERLGNRACDLGLTVTDLVAAECLLAQGRPGLREPMEPCRCVLALLRS